MLYTNTVAAKIASYGAAKMAEQGYTIKRFATADDMAFIGKPGQEIPYIVTVAAGFVHCTCEFKKAGNATCKHIDFFAGELSMAEEYELRVIAREEAADADERYALRF